MLVHREVMEQHLGRKLGPDEVVHHRDGNPSNNAIENLEVKGYRQHARDHRPPPEMISVVCKWCGAEGVKHARQIRHNQTSRGRAGPFCNKSCQAKWCIAERGWGRAPTTGEYGPDGIPHGSRSGYEYHKCRCDKCRARHTINAREQRHRRAMRAQPDGRGNRLKTGRT